MLHAGKSGADPTQPWGDGEAIPRPVILRRRPTTALCYYDRSKLMAATFAHAFLVTRQNLLGHS